MKLNKIAPILGIAFLSMALSTTSLAQTAGPAGSGLTAQKSVVKAKHPLITALGQLSLSADQKSKLGQIISTTKKDNKAFRKAHAGDKAAIKAHAKAEKKTELEAIKGVLNKAPWAQLAGMLHKGKGAKSAKPL